MAEFSIAVPPQGTYFEIEDLEATPVFHKCGGVKQIQRSEAAPPVNDESTLESTFKEKGIGLPDAGQAVLTLQYNRTDVGQAELQAAKADRVKRNGRIVFPDATQEAFSCYVLMAPYNVNVGGTSIEGTITLEITGEPIWS